LSYPTIRPTEPEIWKPLEVDASRTLSIFTPPAECRSVRYGEDVGEVEAQPVITDEIAMTKTARYDLKLLDVFIEGDE